MRLDPRASAAGERLVMHEVLGSTNAEALNLARQGERGPLWVAAGRQTAGRGRRGRAWISQPGNLYVSLLLTGPAPNEHWPQLSFVAALAIHDAIVEVAADLRPQLAIKWPNDLLLAGGKLAGILIEGQTGEAGEEGAVAVGIGVNCSSHPADTDYPATDLAAAGAAVSPATLIGALSVKMPGRLAQWNRGDGFSTIRADWLARAGGLGDDVRVRLAEREITGRFEALDEAGGLVLRLPDGNATTIAAGDVLLPVSSFADNAG
jgi:BirA family biotin operon repressor/biotin-[acetyl-CoA-carboxylase] ligase